MAQGDTRSATPSLGHLEVADHSLAAGMAAA
jgi:hypothetical protein